MFCLPAPTLIYLWEIYIFPELICLFCCRKICWPILGVYKSLTDTWMWKLGRRPNNSQKKINKWNFCCSTEGLCCFWRSNIYSCYYFRQRLQTETTKVIFVVIREDSSPHNSENPWKTEIKGTGSRVRFQNVWQKLQDPGLNKWRSNLKFFIGFFVKKITPIALCTCLNLQPLLITRGVLLPEKHKLGLLPSASLIPSRVGLVNDQKRWSTIATSSSQWEARICCLTNLVNIVY